jgi:acetolactate synthase-1/2/3 large subunit
MGGLGWSTPAAIGASLGLNRARVVTLVGDGGLGFSIMELDTAVRAGAWVVVVLLNNSLLGFQHHWERREYSTAFGTELGTIDYAAIASSLGATSVRTKEISSVTDFLRGTESRPGVYLIDVLTDGNIPGPVSWFSQRSLGVATH